MSPRQQCARDVDQGHLCLPSGRSSLLRSAVRLTLQALDEVLGTPVVTFGETLAYLIYHHSRRAVLLKPAQQLLLADGEVDPS
jgi:hypothetical protein